MHNKTKPTKSLTRLTYLWLSKRKRKEMEVHFHCHVIDWTDEKRCTQVLALTVIYQDLWISFENCLRCHSLYSLCSHFSFKSVFSLSTQFKHPLAMSTDDTLPRFFKVFISHVSSDSIVICSFFRSFSIVLVSFDCNCLGIFIFLWSFCLDIIFLVFLSVSPPLLSSVFEW